MKKILQKAWSTNMSTIFVGESSACTSGEKRLTTLFFFGATFFLGVQLLGVLGNEA